MRVISIQSQVVHGHVGNSAALYPMLAAGVSVAPVPTTLLSNHPRYPTTRGRVLDADLVADLLRGVEERGLVDSSSVVLSGYLGSAANAEVVADFIERARSGNPALRYICDPVLGDDGKVFVASGIEETVATRLLASAHVITPNQFELQRLSGRATATEDDIRTACATLAERGPQVIVATGCTLSDTGENELETVLWQAGNLTRIATPRLPIRPCGTGDLLAGLLAAHLALGKPVEDALRVAVAATLEAIELTWRSGEAELRLTPSEGGPSFAP